MPNEKTNLSYDIYDITGQKVAKGTVTGTLFDPKGFSNLIAQAVRVYKENIRQRNASTKTRGEVAGSTRKIYRQKGTGRARHGDIRAPIFIGGGTVFGPRAVEKKLKISKKMAKLAFMATVLEKIENSQFVAIDGLSELKPKTKLFNELIGKIDKNSKKILFINNGNNLLIKAARNIERVTLSGVSTVNTYDVLTHPMLIIQKESIENFFKRLDMTDEAVVKTKTDKVSKKKKTN